MGIWGLSTGSTWFGAALIGLIHLVEAPEYWGAVCYVGALFGLTAAGSVLAAIGIVRRELWGW